MQWGHRLIALACCLFVGCDSLEDESDKKAKALLVGSWYVEHSEGGTHLLQAFTTHRADGSFASKSKERLSDRPVLQVLESGSWYVTGGLYKLRSEYIDGRGLPAGDWTYFTCRITSIDEKSMTCIDDRKKITLKHVKVADTFQFP